MSLFNNTGQVNTVNVLGQNPSVGGGLDTLAELDAVITQLNIESHTTNTNGNIATVEYVNSLVISGGSLVSSDPVLVSAGNVSLKYDNNSLVLNTSGQLIQNINYQHPLLNVLNDVNLFGDSTNVNFRNTAGTILSSVNNSGSVLTLSSSNLVLTGQSSVSNLNVSSTLFSTSISSGSVRSNTGTIGNFHANNLHAVINGTIGTLVSGSASITNIENSNSSISNLVNTTGTIGTLVSGFVSVTNIDNSNSSISYLVNTTSTIGTLRNNSLISTNSTQTNILVTNISSSSITVSGASRFNNSVEMVVSNTVPSLLISGGITAGNGATIRLHGGGEVGSSVQIDMSTYNPGATDPTSRIRAVDENFSSNLLFQTKTPGAGSNTLSTRMYIKNDGNIGIGNTAPSQRLDVSGNIFCTGNILSNGILDVAANSAGGTITHSIRNNAPPTTNNECRFLSIVSDTNKFSNISTTLSSSGNVKFYVELSRTSGSTIAFGINPDLQETTFRYGLIGPLDLNQDTWDLNETKESLGGPLTAWNRLYLKGNAFIRNVYARTTGQLIGTDDTNLGYRFNILADNITSNNTFITNSTISNLRPTTSTIPNTLITNSTTSNALITALTIRRNTQGWNPAIYLNSIGNGDENFMMFNNIAGGSPSVGSWLVGTGAGVTGGSFNIGFAGVDYALTIRTSGNFGVGTTTPAHKLDVAGTIYAATTMGIMLNSADRPLITRGWDEFTSGTYANIGRWGLFMEPGALTMGLPAGGSGRRHQFVSFNADSSIDKTMMVILESGNVGIGLTNPDYQLKLSQDSAAKPSSTLWTVSSDERLKTNITNANLDICYDNVKNIPLKRYTWKDSVYTNEEVSDRSKLGWIAQDVEGYIPKAVQQKEMHGYSDCRSLNADQIIASLYGAVQKLMEKCEKHDEILDIITNKSPSIRKLFNT